MLSCFNLSNYISIGTIVYVKYCMIVSLTKFACNDIQHSYPDHSRINTKRTIYFNLILTITSFIELILFKISLFFRPGFLQIICTLKIDKNERYIIVCLDIIHEILLYNVTYSKTTK